MKISGQMKCLHRRDSTEKRFSFSARYTVLSHQVSYVSWQISKSLSNKVSTVSRYTRAELVEDYCTRISKVLTNHKVWLGAIFDITYPL